MKRITIILIVAFSTLLNAQYRDQLDKKPDIKSGIVNSDNSSFFGLFNPNNFKMNHTFDVSFQSIGSFGNIALTTYTNSMFYKFNDQLDIQADISLVHSPYNSFGKDFANKLNGIYLSRAQITYKPSENTNIIFQYRSLPVSYYSRWNYYSPFNGFYMNDYIWDEKER